MPGLCHRHSLSHGLYILKLSSVEQEAAAGPAYGQYTGTVEAMDRKNGERSAIINLTTPDVHSSHIFIHRVNKM